MLIALVFGAIAAALAGMSVRPDVFANVLRYWRRALRKHVDEPARRAAGEAKLDEFEQEAASLVTELREWIQSFAEVHRRYESTLADYERLAPVLVAEFYAGQVRLLDLADELRHAIGDDAYFEITDDVEEQLRKARAKQERREGKARARTHCED
jgi:hypothetical protein